MLNGKLRGDPPATCMHFDGNACNQHYYIYAEVSIHEKQAGKGLKSKTVNGHNPETRI